MLNFLQDIQYALRLLFKSPGFTAVAVLTLAVAIGANTALFSVVNCLLLRPLPFPDSERLVVVWAKSPHGDDANLSPADFSDVRRQSGVFDHLGAVTQAEFNISFQGSAERLSGFNVTADFFEALEVQPLLGRTFVADDDRPGPPHVAILSHSAWQRLFGGDRNVVGRAVTLNGAPATIVGVIPSSLRFVFAPEMWTPFAMNYAAGSRTDRYLCPFGKIKRGISLAQARTRLEDVARNLSEAYPASLKGWSIDLVPWREQIIGSLPSHRNILVLFGAVGFVLLIGCVNIANLLLAKAASRQHELAVRASLGASRHRLMKQLLTESVLVALAGGTASLVLSSWLARVAATLAGSFITDSMPEITVDWQILLFTLGLAIFTGLLFGGLPAWRASRIDLNRALKEAGAASTVGSSGKRYRTALVVAEVALSLMLLVSAGLMARSVAAAYSTDVGMRRLDKILTVRLTMPGARYADAALIRRFDRQLLEGVRALPGVEAAALSTFLPLEGLAEPMPFEIASHPVPISERPTQALQAVSAGYFENLGIGLRQGRFFTDRDGESAPYVAVVNEALARRYFPKEQVLGQRLLMAQPKMSAGQTSRMGKMDLGVVVAWEIVGLSANVREGVQLSNVSPMIYVPLMQWTHPGGALALRAAGAPAALIPSVRAVARELDKDVPISDVRTMQQIADTWVAHARSQAWIVGSFAAVGLILSALGIYGVISYAVAQSTHEIGIRMALGAQPAQLLRLTLRKGMTLAVAGLALGLAGSFALGRVLQSLLYGVEATDPLTYFTVSGVLLAVAALATYLPARRAAHVDPSVALRWE